LASGFSVQAQSALGSEKLNTKVKATDYSLAAFFLALSAASFVPLMP